MESKQLITTDEVLSVPTDIRCSPPPLFKDAMQTPDIASAKWGCYCKKGSQRRMGTKDKRVCSDDPCPGVSKPAEVDFP